MDRVLILTTRTLAVLILVAGGAQLSAAPASAAEKNLGMTAYAQEQSNWCWAAVAKMIVKFHTGRVVSQCELVKDGRRSSTCPNVAGTKGQTLNALHANGVNGGVEMKLDWSTVTNQINASRPVQSGITWIRTGTGHAHVIRGWYSTGYSSGVSYIDPAGGVTETREWSNYMSNTAWRTSTGLVSLWG
jgi:hypothetical protein